MRQHHSFSSITDNPVLRETACELGQSLHGSESVTCVWSSACLSIQWAAPQTSDFQPEFHGRCPRTGRGKRRKGRKEEGKGRKEEGEGAEEECGRRSMEGGVWREECGGSSVEGEAEWGFSEEEDQVSEVSWSQSWQWLGL